MSLKLLWDEENASELNEDLTMLKLFDDLKLDVYDFKMQDMNTMSMKGAFHFLKGEIPFAMSLSSEQIVIELEGAEKPVVIDLTAEVANDLDDEYLAFQEELASKSPEIVEGIGTFLIKQMSNPKNIKVSSGNEMINNESVFVHKLSSEICADEILDFVKTAIT